MAASGVKGLPTVGFLTVVENEQFGYIGGLLILNVAGRPLEFHCTAPLKPNRAQEILYGPTLRPFLYGEQIGQTLLSKTKSETLFVCTDVEPAMGARDSVELPLVFVCDSTRGTAGRETTLRVDGAHALGVPHSSLSEFSLGRHQVAVLSRHGGDRERVIQLWQPHQDLLDLVEPFGRIREALDEAQRGAAK